MGLWHRQPRRRWVFHQHLHHHMILSLWTRIQLPFPSDLYYHMCGISARQFVVCDSLPALENLFPEEGCSESMTVVTLCCLSVCFYILYVRLFCCGLLGRHFPRKFPDWNLVHKLPFRTWLCDAVYIFSCVLDVVFFVYRCVVIIASHFAGVYQPTVLLSVLCRCWIVKEVQEFWKNLPNPLL